LFALIVVGIWFARVLLLGELVDQHNPCALVIMPLFMLLAIFLKTLSWQTLLYQIISFFFQNKRQDLSLRLSFYQN
jgi:hypothetical protein